ncbi:MAG: hypothetical protein Q7S16_01610 [bacterium]|nr:hypothetical protein [bacterium]
MTPQMRVRLAELRVFSIIIIAFTGAIAFVIAAMITSKPSLISWAAAPLVSALPWMLLADERVQIMRESAPNASNSFEGSAS